MTAPKILVGQAGQPKGISGAPLEAAPSLSWRILGWTGWLFFLIGGLDVAITWVPSGFGNPEWEFGTVSASLNGLPVTTMGLMLVLGAALAQGRRWVVRMAALLLIVLAVAVLIAGLLYATNVPMALNAVTQPVARAGLIKSMVKTASQVVMYPALFLLVGAVAWRHTTRRLAQ